MIYNIAIDGPAGAGKSTIARNIAKKLDFIYVDTGSMYRAVAYCLLKKQVDIQNEEAVETVCKEADITMNYKDGEQQIFLNNENVTSFLRTEEIGQVTSKIATYKAVRVKLVEVQQELATRESLVMDGRDIGTCVLPDADLKIYLTASVETRAMRRYKELTEKNISCNMEEIQQGIKERDEQDMNREISPLKQADDAIFVDSSDMTIEEVTDYIIRLFQNKEC